MLKWVQGRSANPDKPYFKIKLAESKWLMFDVYLLKYPEGSEIGWHKDPSQAFFEHWRANIVLKKAIDGGKFACTYDIDGIVTEPVIRKWNDRFIVFRPDITVHCVKQVKKGTRYVLSIGWLRGKIK